MRIRGSDGVRADDGFSLVELVVVLIILGILATIAIASYAGTAGGAEDAACRANQRTLESAIPVYQAQTSDGQFPTEIADIRPYVGHAWDVIAVCPSDNTSLTYDPITHDISCVNHP
ncbi:MAG: prepilin-type N-terminal cleavage/methylation domain-containing protein [Coriobacteriia bacterium]